METGDGNGMQKNGMLHFSPADKKMKSGDVIVIPSYVFGGIKPKNVNLSLFKEYRIKRDNWYKKFSMIWFYSYFNFYSEEKSFLLTMKMRKFSKYIL